MRTPLGGRASQTSETGSPRERTGLYSTFNVGAVARQGQRKGDFLAGKYLLEDCLGVGGMGEVYRATNVSLGRKVAIKLLSPEYVNNEEDVLRFLREARAAAAVRHANVVDVLDVARDDDGTPFIVQELLSGEDLEHYLRSRRDPLSSEEALEIMIPVADAVAAAHAQNVVHRDLKPANIFLARERNRIVPKVLDFGACLFPTLAERSAKEKRMLIGTPHYMAPEQILSKADVDARSDVWAIGIILYEMLVGETPFEAESANAVLQLVKTREVPLLRERVPSVPPDLEELVALCTKRDRLARLPDASAVHARMEAIRRRMRAAASPRFETMVDSPSLDIPLSEIPIASGVASKPHPAPPESARPAKRGGLLTLSSPGSEPPPSIDDLDLDLPLPDGPESGLSPFPPPVSAKRPKEPGPAALALGDPSGLRMIEPLDDPPPSASLDLAARPSSWPPPSSGSGSARASTSSLPPVLDPRAAGRPPPSSSRPPSDGPPRAEPVASAPKGPPPAIAKAPAGPARSAREGEWSTRETAKFVVAVAVPALLGFFAVLAVPAVGGPIGRALRGDSTVASGVLTVLALICAAALCGRALLGERDRWISVAAGGAVLFGIVMIIVTFSASEAAQLGVPSSIGGLASVVAPLAPLVLALKMLGKAREVWVDPYSRGEAVKYAAFASAMLFLTLALSPVGAVRAPSRATQAQGASSR